VSLTRRALLPGIGESLLLASLTSLALARNALARSVAPGVVAWLKDANDLALSVRGKAITQAEWQASMARLLSTVALGDLLELIDFERLVSRSPLPRVGERFTMARLPRLEGLPDETAFFKSIAGFGKGRSIPPHGHNHLVSSFLVLRGQLRGRHFDRVADDDGHATLQPTSDRIFGAGDFSTISQVHDNVHWFTSETEGAFIFDLGVIGLDLAGSLVPLPTRSPMNSGRIYLDVKGAQALSNGQLRAARVPESVAYKLYG
jgi:hypothetical protein